jgi:hypothetical protein
VAGQQGVSARVTSWTTAELDSPNFKAQVTAGWFGEMVVFGMFGLVGIGAGRKWVLFTGGFPLGHMLATWVRGYGSYDFSTGLKSYIDSFSHLSETARYSTYLAARDSLMTVWTMLCIGIVVVVAGMAVYFLNKKPIKKRSPGRPGLISTSYD